MAAPAYGGSTTLGASLASGTSAAVSAPVGRSVGDELTAHLYLLSTAITVPTPAGWALVNRTDGSGFQINSYERVATGDANDSFSASWTGSVLRNAAIAYWTGSDAVAPINAVGADNSGSNNAPVALGVTTTVADCRLVGYFNTSNASVFTPPAGWTTHLTIDGVLIASAAQAAVGASGNKTGSYTTSESWAAHMFAIAPTAAAVAGGPRPGSRSLLGVGR